MSRCGSGAVVCSWSLLIRWAQRARCQAETPLIALFRFPRPALNVPALERWDQTLLYVSQESLSIHGSFDQHRSHDAGLTQASDSPPAFVGRSSARSSKNSKANRIEAGKKSGGIRRNLFGGSRRKIAKKIADHRPRNAVKRRRRAIDQKAMLSTLR